MVEKIPSNQLRCRYVSKYMQVKEKITLTPNDANKLYLSLNKSKKFLPKPYFSYICNDHKYVLV